MQARSLEEAREVVNSRVSRSAFRPGDDVVRNPGADGELALTKVCDRACGANVSICRKIVHQISVAY